MQAPSDHEIPNRFRVKWLGMPTSQEPNEIELRQRIRNWLRHYKKELGFNNREMAQALSFSDATISNLLRDLEDPGLDCLVRMHFRFGMDLAFALRHDPRAPEATVKARK